MVTGGHGHYGQAAPKHVTQEQEAGQESVTTQLQLWEEETVRDQAVSQEFVALTNVQVIPFIKCFKRLFFEFPKCYITTSFFKLMVTGDTG